MRIGPLTYKSPFTTMAGQMFDVFGSTGVMRGHRVAVPESMLPGGAIEYNPSHGKFCPMLDVGKAKSAAENFYRRAGGDPSAETRFMTEVQYVESMFSLDASMIARVFRTDSIMGRGTEAGDKAVRRTAALGDLSLGDIISIYVSGDTDSVPDSTSTMLLELGEDANYAAGLKWREGERHCCREAAVLSFASGLLLIASGKAGAGDVSAAFLNSSGYFTDAEMPIAAAVLAEYSLFINNAVDMRLDPKRDTERRVASYWLKIARELDGVDPAGFKVAVHRGLIAAFMGGDKCSDILRALLMRSARIHSSLGMHSAAAADYLRIILGQIGTFRGRPAEWTGLADSLRMAIGSYKREGDSEEIISTLEDLEDLARRVGDNLRDETDELDRMILDAPDDVVSLGRRGVLRLKYGNFNGAIADLGMAKLLSGGDPELTAEIGLAYHMHSDLLRRTGSEVEATDYLNMAMERLTSAQFDMEDDDDSKADDGPMPLLRARIGAVYASMGYLDQAIEELELAHDKDPGDRDIAEYLDAVREAGERSRLRLV